MYSWSNNIMYVRHTWKPTCEFKKYDIFMSKYKLKNRPTSNKKFHNKMNWKISNINLIIVFIFNIESPFHIENSKNSHGIFNQWHV
jgi:hypothetical protein